MCNFEKFDQQAMDIFSLLTLIFTQSTNVVKIELKEMLSLVMIHTVCIIYFPGLLEKLNYKELCIN